MLIIDFIEAVCSLILWVNSAEMDKLWKFANNAESFELKDIEAALSEIQVILW